MEIFTYINFLTGPSESAQTGDSINPMFLMLLCFSLILASALFFILKSKRINLIVKKIIGICLPSVFLILSIPFAFATQSYADGTSSIIDAVVDPETCTAYIQDGNIQNTTSDDMMLVVANSKAINAGQNIGGLQNANLKVTVGDYVIFQGNPFDDFDTDLYDDYILKPGQTVQYSTQLTGLDKQTCQALVGSGNSIQMRFKFYYSFDWDGHYKITNEAQAVADYLYEVEYESWNVDKCNFICECIGKDVLTWGQDTREYKDYLRKEWGLNEDEIQLIVQIRKYFEETDSYFPALCTSCRTGNYIGRNFDWAYDDLDEYIVRADKTRDHYKSIGVVSSFFPQAMQDAINIKTMLPMLTMDGINENGVAVNINVVPPDAFGATTGTNPGAERLCAGVVPRFVLDNASSAAQAVELLKNRDIFTVTFSEFHFMISDAKESYIVETCNNELVVLQQDVSKPTAMSNFHVSNSEHYDEYNCVWGKTEIGPIYSAHSMGVERYNLAMKDITTINTLDKMVDHMKPIYYENVNCNWEDKAFWSDKNGQKSVVKGHEDHVFSYYDTDAEWGADKIATFEHNEENYNNIHAREDEIGWRLKTGENSNGVCQTVHASCYDLANRELAVNVQERDVTFHFTLSGVFREKGSAHEAKDLYVNGDNVGLATSCEADGSAWTYDKASNTLTLSDVGVYSIAGSDVSTVTISGQDKVGYSVTIPKIEHATAKVYVGENTVPTKARMGIRAVPKNSKITVRFIADSGYVFVNDHDEEVELVQEINPIIGNITFGTPEYPLPVTKKKDLI